MKETVVLLQVGGMGHLAPMVELGKLFIRHGFAVTVVVADSPDEQDPAVAALIKRICTVHPAISFHQLPPVSHPPPPNPDPFVAMWQPILHTNPLLRDFLVSLRRTATVRALVLGLFSTMAFDVAAELHIPAYLFFTTATSALAAYLYFPTFLADASGTDLKDLGDAPLHFPELPPIPASHVPNRSGEACRLQLYHMGRAPRADAILVNTLDSLETRAVRALKDGLYLPGRPTPPVYYIGPLITEGRAGEERHECLSWLDNQPKGSVVFLSFGSWGRFPEEQLKEIAAGLERCGQRFLWVVRSPNKVPAEPDLDALLPEGFLERTKERGLVVESWAPQVEVLGHDSVGGFVTHCGWNSTLEAICAGLPLIAWPLYAEQRMNKVFLVEGMRLAVAMEGYDKELVTAEEVAAKVRWLMESEGGRDLRERMRAAKEKAAAAWKEGGSSRAAWMEVIKVLKGGHG